MQTMESKRVPVIQNSSIKSTAKKDTSLEIRPIGNSSKSNTQVKKNLNREALEIRPVSMMSSVHQIQNAMLQAQHDAQLQNSNLANIANTVQFQNTMLQMQNLQNPALAQALNYSRCLMQLNAFNNCSSLEIKPINVPSNQKNKGVPLDVSKASASIPNAEINRIHSHQTSTITSKDLRIEQNKRVMPTSLLPTSTITSKDVHTKKQTVHSAPSTSTFKEAKGEGKRAKLQTLSHSHSSKEAKAEPKRASSKSQSASHSILNKEAKTVAKQLQSQPHSAPSIPTSMNKDTKTEFKRISSQGALAVPTSKNGKSEVKRPSLNNMPTVNKEIKTDSKKHAHSSSKSAKSEMRRALLQPIPSTSKHKENKDKDKEKEKVSNKKVEKSISTSAIRFTLKLSESTDSEYPTFNYSDMVKDAEKKRRKEKKKDDRTISNGNAFDEENDGKVLDVARYYEEKYGRGKKRDNVDLGAGYDEEDSFIDNTDAYDEVVPEEVTTAHGGFYVNSGPLEFKNTDKVNRRDQDDSDDSSDDDEDDEEDSTEEEDDEEDEDSEKESDIQDKNQKEVIKKAKRTISSDDSMDGKRTSPPPKSKPRTSTDNSDCVVVE